MSILDTLAGRFGYQKAKQAPMPPILQATGEGQSYTIPDYTLAEAQEQLFERLSWVYGAVMAVATTMASAQLNVLKLQGEKRKDIPNHDLEMRLMRPNPLDSRSEFMVKTGAFLATTGNCYWWLNRRNETQPPSEIWVLPPHQVEPIPDGRMFLKGYTYQPGLGEQDVTLEPWQVIHFRRFHPRNWFVGLSPIESLAVVSEGDIKQQEYNRNFFGKDNGKVPGALAFSDDVGTAAWDKLKADIKANWGGTKRSGPMLLRGVGQGGVQWVSMALSQADMQFLESRTFTKEEIYGIFAPGLASVLAVNATEANAKSGKATFIDMAVWPQLVAVAEKITNNLLPAYGDNLVAEFDDIRVVDRVLALQEQDAYGKVHTLNEMRDKFYDDKPMEDERGEMLPAQIRPATPMPTPEGEEPQTQENMPPMQPLEQEAPQEATGEEVTPLEAEAMQAQGEALKELAAWRRYAVRHGAEKAQTFIVDHIPDDVAEGVREALKTATTADEIKAVFANDEERLAARMGKAAPPPQDEAERRAFERRIENVMADFFEQQNRRVEAVVRRAFA